MGKIFTATYSFSSWAFHTQPKRPLAFTSINCSGLCPKTGDGGEGPGSCRQWGELLLRMQLKAKMIKSLAVLECKFTTAEKSNSLSLAFLHSKSAGGLLDCGGGGGGDLEEDLEP